MPLARRVLLLVAAVCPTTAGADPPFPPELTRFEPYAHNYVFTPAGAGSWDTKIRERGWILREGGEWRMWYTGYDGSREGRRRLGYATSDDGLRWTRHPANPLLPDLWVEDMTVVRHDGRYLMFCEGEGDQAQLLASGDGLRWERLGRLDVRLTNGQPIPPGPFGTPAAFVEDGVWHLFYERRDAGVWLATSADLKVWTNVSDEPVLTPGPHAYDASRIALNQVVKHGGRYYALYHGTDDAESPSLWTSNVAASDDLRSWTKYEDNPLFPKATNRSSNILVPTADGKYRLYTMHDRVEAFLPAPEPAGGN